MSIIRQNSTLSSKDPSIENSGVYIHLPTRGLLEIRGKDASKFLQGLVTNHMPRIESGGGGFLAAFLSPKVSCSQLRDYIPSGHMYLLRPNNNDGLSD